MSTDVRPSPEHFLSLIQRQQRGRLKIYLGFAAGVGKTYEMLQEAHRIKNKVDVVVAVVETHGRPETAALVEGLELVPRRRVEYKGVVLEEMDLDAVMARHPRLALVDEVAHTNAPGSRFKKRYQDVEELLRAGINVISTLNIQHLESLHDIVEKATGVKVKERVPDYVVGLADELVNVDISAEDLRERLLAGKVYPADRIDSALKNFFTLQNLTRLREMTIEEIAHRLDRRRHEQQSGAAVQGGSERVMVALSSRSPNSASLLRKAARVADRLGAPWYAVYIQTPSENLERIDAATQRQVTNMQELARQLGGTAFTFKGPDVAATIATFVKEYGITLIVLGRTQRPWYQRFFGRSVLDGVLRHVHGVDVVIADCP
jgi:two-component system, OmpR family, sensor histidine kinase KdpD